MVKFRSKEQISSEEYLRLGNSVHLQRNANLDSAPANSGESPYTDHAGKRNFCTKFQIIFKLGKKYMNNMNLQVSKKILTEDARMPLDFTHTHTLF